MRIGKYPIKVLNRLNLKVESSNSFQILQKKKEIGTNSRNMRGYNISILENS